MARTKKFLANSNRTRSFYRPLKRINFQSQAPSANSVNFLKAKPVRKAIKSSDDLTQAEFNQKQDQINTNRTQNFTQLEPETTLSKPTFSKSRQDLPVISLDLNPVDENIVHEKQSLPEPANTESIDYLNHDITEDLAKLEMGLDKSQEKDEKITKQLKEIQSEFEKEKEIMQKTIHVLKKEIAEQTPIRENKFFTISKELSEINQAMHHLLESEQQEGLGANTIQPTVVNSNPSTMAPNIADQVKIISSGDINKTSSSPVAADQAQNKPETPATTQIPGPKSDQEITKDTLTSPPQVIPADNQAKPDLAKTKKRKIPKPVAIIISTLIITGVIGGSAWYFLNKKPQVNTQLVQQYLPADAASPNPESTDLEEKKIEQSTESAAADQPEATAQVQGASDSQYAESQADVPYAQTVWEIFKDPGVGIEINYPKNTVNAVKTESSITFLRKTGYIFKIQIYETALDINEYWKSIKANSLNYKIKETTFREKPALFLELEDITEYPGDRYLVKNGDYVYDIWYATYGNTVSDDDIKRIEIMLNSFKFFQNE